MIAEAEQTVDFFLVEDALGAALGALETSAVVHHRRPLGGGFIDAGRGKTCGRVSRLRAGIFFQRQPPFGGQRVLVDLLVQRHW